MHALVRTLLCAGALSLAATATSMACDIGSSSDVVLCGGNASPGNPGCKVRPPTVSPPATFDLTNLYNLPSGAQSTWWVPIDNIPDLAGFSHIDITVSGGDITLQAQANRDAMLRVRIYWCK